MERRKLFRTHDLVSVTQLTLCNHGTNSVENNARCKLGSVVVDIIGRGDLNHFHSTQSLTGNQTHHFKGFSW